MVRLGELKGPVVVTVPLALSMSSVKRTRCSFTQVPAPDGLARYFTCTRLSSAVRTSQSFCVRLAVSVPGKIAATRRSANSLSGSRLEMESLKEPRDSSRASR